MKTIRQSQVKNMQPLMRQLVSPNGRTVWWVQWMPDTCGNDAAQDNLNRVGIVWDTIDACPVWPCDSRYPGYPGHLREARESYAGTWSCVHEAWTAGATPVPMRDGKPDPQAVAALPPLSGSEYRVLYAAHDKVRIDDFEEVSQ